MNFKIGNFEAIEGTGGGVTEERVQELIGISMQSAYSQGKMDDVRTYTSYDHFPGNSQGRLGDVAVSDVQYVAMDTGIEYQWVVDATKPQGGFYREINKIVTEQDVKDVFN